MTATNEQLKAQAELALWFQQSGYMRVPDPARRKNEKQTYKMGYEIRLVAGTKSDLAALRRLIRSSGLKSGKPFAKANQWVQPIYGRQAMDTFNSWLERFAPTTE